MPDYKISEFAKCLPDMLGEEYQELVADIKRVGLVQDIVLHKGEILDGRHRYRACLETGVEPRFTEYVGEDPAGYVISVNLKRRNLTVSQKAMAVAKMEALKKKFEDEGKEQQKAGKGEDGSGGRGNKKTLASRDAKVSDPHNNKTAFKMAKIAGISGSTMERARFVEAKGTPEDVAQVDRGEVTVNAKVEEIKERQKGETIEEAAHMEIDETGAEASEEAGTEEKPGQKGKKKDDAAFQKMLAWAAKKGMVDPEQMSEEFGVVIPHCQRYLRTAADTKGYLVESLPDGSYMVRKAVHISLKEVKDIQTDLPGILGQLYRDALDALEADKDMLSGEWTRKKRLEFLQKVLRITGPFKK